ncbi:hypothetical protein [Vibrio parahaemolyticus]|uniref:hypothetical protein n=1 Tax=Vibrio parahaemolyticus TaxID=670 RepID=UPI00215BCC57|nr:hypothetical protein [Vibrio parahaemolyticus]EGQ8535753.1 hypothetical protein [Vibrio parahaemolyticus]EJB8505219.1 hypothetical protein [Vibrio parahaemolyticus]EJL3960115.1 hypothetical protein [Vibrio parahaemolyticus]MCR9868084.1 hypothetical protein [Vibrio parahaemolyticus]
MMNETMMTQDQYNAVALAQVDTDGDKCEETCPDCGKLAVRHDFECCHSGSVNAHYTLNCSHCGYHECDQDECSICDEAISLTRHHYDEAAKWVTFFYSIEECLMNGRGVPGLLWTEFKHVVHQQPEVVGWLDTFLDLEGVNAEQLILHFKQQMVKVRFDLRFN